MDCFYLGEEGLEEFALEDKKEIAERMAEVYYGGFGNAINYIVDLASVYMFTPERGNPNNRDLSKYRERAFDEYYEVKEHFDQLSFEELRGEKEYYPTFVISLMLPDLKERLEETFEQEEKDKYEQLLEKAKAINEVGELYRQTIAKVCEEVRASGEEDFKVVTRVQDDGAKEYF